MRTTVLTLASALLCLALLGGCSANRTTRSSVVGATAPASGQVNGDSAYPRVSGTKRFTYERSNWGETLTHSMVKTFVPQNDGTWLIHSDDDGVRKQTSRFVRTPKGVSILETQDFESATVTYFRDGGLMVMPTHARPEGLYGNTVTVEIFDMGDDQKIKQRGTATRDIEYIADEPISTPAGLFRAGHIRSVLLMELSTANVSQTDHFWVHDDFGIVAEDSKLQARVFGVPVKTSSRLALLAEKPANWREPSAAVGEPIIEPMTEQTEPLPEPERAPSGLMSPVR